MCATCKFSCGAIALQAPPTEAAGLACPNCEQSKMHYLQLPLQHVPPKPCQTAHPPRKAAERRSRPTILACPNTQVVTGLVVWTIA